MITIVLDRASFEPGSQVTGRIEGAFPTADVVVRLVWETGGKGTIDRADVDMLVLPATPGGAEPRGFAMTLPLLPLTYTGELLSVSWSLVADTVGESTFRPFVVAWPR